MSRTFILFAVDYLAAVEPLNDEIANMAAKAMPQKRFLAYVDQIISLNTHQAWLKYHLVLVSKGLPEKNEEQGVEPGMCNPIFPTTYHPTGREPLQLSSPLPFEDCYTHSHIPLAIVRIRSETRNYRNAI
ncbi:hypothetical protein BDN72DRAFT_795692, partial [Pluteus cervinus]